MYDGETIRWAREDVTCPTCGHPAGTNCEGMDGYSVHVERVVAYRRKEFLASLEETMRRAERYALTVARAMGAP